ncbi:hypothetical protein BDZ94DRAFT_1156757 [Collybia nuda]|uniref:Fe2OG dioxygenase domain-containing protein n=1 Tax=Collybia nuda TaxID=64659 RepID=A0A9P6CI23_9AGAR|nr:hypothetical protein BDZ94DRAFT_1156757 [Collybia nuda]
MPPTVNGDLFDFASTPLSTEYSGTYVKVLDDLFTPQECEDLISLAESEHEWDVALVSTSTGDRLMTDYRNSERILRFDHDTANKIFERLLPYVQELVEIKPGGRWEEIVGYRKRMTSTWNLVGINERLSFLRYGPGNFFHEHCDGQLRLPDGRHSKVTLQIYLKNEKMSGGATRFQGNNGRFVDIEPKVGRVLIFQQKKMYHSGQEVTKGLKYALRSDFMFRETKASD